MATKSTSESRYAKKLQTLTTEQLADEMRWLQGEIRSTPNETYRSEQQANLTMVSAEIQRREDGGAVAHASTEQYLTDGERLALGLSDRDDNI